MKKRLLPLLVAICSMMISLNVFAGDVNSAEQRILNVISQTYSYKGYDYKVTDEYYAKVVEYLSRDDIDMTGDEVTSYILQFYDNIPAGIAGGYMECVGPTPTKKPANDQKPEKDDEDNWEADTPQEETSGTDTSEQEQQAPAPSPSASQAVSPTATDAAQTPKTDEASGAGTKGNTTAATVGTTPADAKPQNTADEPDALEDHTIAATTDGVVEYTVNSYSAVMYVWDIDKLEVHKEAYKDSEVIGSYAKGEQVIITGATSTGWAQVDYSGETGYVSAVYLRTDKYMTDNEVEKDEETGNYVSDKDKDGDGKKDYSNAAPLSGTINIGTMAIIAVILIIIVCGGIVLYHKGKHKRR